MRGYFLQRTGLVLVLSMSLFGTAASAQDEISWSAIDFQSCPLNSPLRVADKSTAIQYMSLQGCSARIVAVPPAPIQMQPEVARIVGVKADEPAAPGRGGAGHGGRRAADPVAPPPPGTRRIAYMPGLAALPRIDMSYDPHVQAAAAAYRIDPLFLHAIIGTESTYVPHALSHAGARGLMQIMPATGQQFGVAREALYDPATNIDTGARLLKRLQARYGNNFQLILAAYNAGEGAVARYGNQVPPYRETQDYVVKVMGRYQALRAQPGFQQALYGQAGS